MACLIDGHVCKPRQSVDSSQKEDQWKTEYKFCFELLKVMVDISPGQRGLTDCNRPTVIYNLDKITLTVVGTYTRCVEVEEDCEDPPIFRRRCPRCGRMLIAAEEFCSWCLNDPFPGGHTVEETSSSWTTVQTRDQRSGGTTVLPQDGEGLLWVQSLSGPESEPGTFALCALWNDVEDREPIQCVELCSWCGGEQCVASMNPSHAGEHICFGCKVGYPVEVKVKENNVTVEKQAPPKQRLVCDWCGKLSKYKCYECDDRLCQMCSRGCNHPQLSCNGTFCPNHSTHHWCWDTDTDDDGDPRPILNKKKKVAGVHKKGKKYKDEDNHNLNEERRHGTNLDYHKEDKKTLGVISEFNPKCAKGSSAALLPLQTTKISPSQSEVSKSSSASQSESSADEEI